jgi:hypothetical protein
MDLPNETRTTLRAFCANLADLIEAFARSTSPRGVLCEFNDGKFVQVWASLQGAVGEVVANEFLDASQRLTWFQERDLVSEGWSAPDSYSPNWHVARSGERAHVEITRLVHGAIRTIRGCHESDDVIVEVKVILGERPGTRRRLGQK